MAPVNRNVFFQKTMLKNKRKRKSLLDFGKAIALSCRIFLLQLLNWRIFVRCCRRLQRNYGWWKLVWSTYSDERFKKAFRVSRTTFSFILSRVRHKLERKTLEPVSPECRLGLCLYRLARGDYFYIISEMVGLGQSTVSTIVGEVNEAIVNCMWKECVSAHITHAC